jgi:hypothetical protein
MRTSSRVTLPGQPPQTQVPQLQAQTDDQGHFAFQDLEAGGYRVTVQRQGFIGQNGMPGGPPPYVEVWLGEGQQLTGYVVRATPQSVISGTVRDEFGDPVMGAQVFAKRAGSANTRQPNMNAGNAQSNDLGEFRIPGLAAGDYIVGATYQDRSRMYAPPNRQATPDKPQLVYAATYHPGTTVASEAAVIHVPEGGAVVSGIDVKLAKIAAYSVHVTVVDSDGPANPSYPFTNYAFPNLRRRDPEDTFGGFFGAQRQQDGTYLFTGVPPGSYELTAQRNNPGTPGSVASANMPIEVRDRNLEGVVLEVKPNADLQGSVRFDQPGGCNANNLSVGLRTPGPPGGIVYGPMPGPARVGDDLRFELKNVPPGVYAVNLQGGIGRCYVKSAVYRGQAAPADALTVTESGSLDIVLAAYNGQLSVTAVDRDGNPAPRARIMAVPRGGSSMSMGGMNGMTGPSGQVTLGSIRPGTYDVYAFETAGQSPQFFSPNGDALKPFEGRGKTVTVADTGRATVEVIAIPASEAGAAVAPPPPTGAKGSLAGSVVNAINGSAMAGVVVTLRGQNIGVLPRAPSVVTDGQGRFAFPNLSPGQYSLSGLEQRFVGEGPGPLGGFANWVIVGEGQQVSAYVLKLVPGGVIAGMIEDESGEPVLGARVGAFSYRNQNGQRRLTPAGTAQSDDLGKYRIANLSAGDYYVSVTPILPGRAAAAVLPAALFSAGAGTPIASPRGAQTPTVETITGPLPAEAEMDYVPVWYPNASQPAAASAVRVAVGATAGNIDVTLRKAKVVRIRGKVVDGAGGAVGTPIVTLTPKGSQLSPSSVGSALIARDGTFEISGVPPGSYRLIARPGPTGGGVGGSVISMGAAGSSLRMAVQAIEVKDSPIEGINLELSAGRTVKGSIRMEGGGAVPRPAYFSLTSLEGMGSGMISMGGDGTFTVNNVFPLVYTVNSQNLPANSYVKSIRFGGREVSSTGFELTGDGQLEVVLSNTAAVLEGSIAGTDGKPAGNASIVVAPVAGPLPARTGNADARGNFYFANLPPGDYRVAAWDAAAPEASDPPQSLGTLASAAKAVKLGENAHEKVQVTVVPAGR